jgi:hypothetical protein
MTRRVLHLRHPAGFSQELFERFRAGCRLFQVHVETTLLEWTRFPAVEEGVRGEYRFSTPELSADCLIASLTLEGPATVGSRAAFENASSYLLRMFLPYDFKRDLEEGLTETVATGETLTHWRKPTELLERALATATPFRRGPE